MNNTFRTEIKIKPSKHKIGIKSSILSMGSCFADNVVSHFQKHKLQAHNDPLGIAFNPISISKRILFALNNRSFDDQQLIFNDDIALHLQAHSSINSNSETELKKIIQECQKKTLFLLQNSNYLILTFGTSFVHEHLQSEDIVANCHKQSPNLFSKKLLTLQEINSSISEALRGIIKLNPTLKIILTVSPVRHTREGLSENSLSKSILRHACHLLEEEFELVDYFPSYEIMMDDLRSYRFYESDLIHPNKQAKEYIFKHFEEAFFSQELKEHFRNWFKVSQRINHKPLHSQSSSYEKFLLTLLEDLNSYPFPFDLSQEISQTKSKLSTFNNLDE